MIAPEFKSCFEKAEKKDYNVLVKDKQCATCTEWLVCRGKPRGTANCLNYQERKPNG